MAEVKESSILIQDVETKNIMTKSTLPVGGYSVNPYVGCTHGCKYCYASFMKRFTGHTEPWGTFLDVKHWPAIKNPQKYKGQRVVIGSVTDGYLPQEAQFQNTRKLLEQLRGSEAEILICTKSDLVIRDIELLKELGKVTVSWSINTLYDAIYNKGDRSYFRGLEDQAERLAKENSCPFVDNELPYGRAEPGHPVIVDYFYHEEVRGSENTGRRNPQK